MKEHKKESTKAISAPYEAADVAKYIIWKSRNINNFRLQYLLYFVQAEFLAHKNRPCYKDPIEAWSFGPVVPTVYDKYKVYGAGIFPSCCFQYDESDFVCIADSDKNTIDRIIESCRDYDTGTLRAMTQQQTPWINGYYKNNGTITNESIRSFFAEISIMDVAAYILHRKGTMSCMKLQKLCYYANEWYKVWYQQPLFQEKFESWKTGPVCRKLFEETEGERLCKVSEHDISGNKDVLDEDAQNSVNKVLDYYGNMSSQALLNMTLDDQFAKKSEETDETV